MRKMSTKKKGFSLIELIIVLAIFSIIMVLVMSFIDPVSNVMKKSSTREKTAAYVDNINEYVDKSLRYASFVRIFENDFCNKEDNEDILTEQEAVKAFVEDYFDGAINSEGNRVSGKVHVLKLLNEPNKDKLTKDSFAAADIKDGMLIDVVYDFIAGETKLGGVSGTEKVYVSSEAKLKPNEAEFPQPYVKLSTNELAVNPEHFLHYSYYYRLGFNEFIPVSNRTVTVDNPIDESAAYDRSLITNSDGTANLYSTPDGDPISVTNSGSSDFFYSELITMHDKDDVAMNMVSRWSFAVTVVAYPNDSHGDNKIDCIKTYTDGTDEPAIIFKSPSYMATASMSLANINRSDMENKTCVKVSRKAGGDPVTGGALVRVETYDRAFSYPNVAKHDDATKDSTNIYFIYVVPSEINNG